MKKLLFAILAFFTFTVLVAQPPAPKQDTLRKDALNVFMDASDYVKKEIPFINYVRDIKVADLYIITTFEQTGSGGYKYTYFLEGQGKYQGKSDTLSFISTPDDTEETTRIKQVQTLKMGLMRYVEKTPLASYMNITFTEPLSETVTTDKWKSWVFRTNLSGYLTGQKMYKSTNVNTGFSASKVTKDWKINLDASYYFRKDLYITDTLGTRYVSTYDEKSLNVLIVRSINDHWSYGGTLYLGGSSYSNYFLNSKIMPGIEYDIFPYSQSTRKQLRLLYKIGAGYYIYNDTTIYERTRQPVGIHSFTAAYQVVEKWGSINLSMVYSNYLQDWSKNNLGTELYLELRVAKGLRVYWAGGAYIVHDQINLPKQGASVEEMLTRRRELESQYNYYSMFGFSYTFGSIYNNVVNPRFSSGSNNMIMF
ncbi:MAG TPA: hypothetical protein VMT63_07625 [Bacteroidales bacterium]|nr:hypothetical protein [Bacteroidales bacterium]